jgi:DNA repair protein RadA/Sms
MAKQKIAFECGNCGALYSKWQGQCDNCKQWNRITEVQQAPNYSKLAALPKKHASDSGSVKFLPISANIEDAPRIDTDMQELNRAFGGGIVKGSAILLGGDPGIGKSTILLQLAASFIKAGLGALYITGEESLSQVQLRARRLGVEKCELLLATATNVAEIIHAITKKQSERAVDLLIIDSIQTMFLPFIESTPGTVSQVRASAHELITKAKELGIALVLVGHVTKEGQIAGPKLLEHMVDTVLYFEGEKGANFRILRAVKNRFGAANEIGVFEMMEQGLQEVGNPSSIFIENRVHNVAGSAIYAGTQGSRTILLEVQALASKSNYAMPKRVAIGFDLNRLSMILAVLQSKCGIHLSEQEVYLNIAGGVKITEPAIDLAVGAALISARLNKAFPKTAVFMGEIGLSGEIRAVSNIEARIKEAIRLGFTQIIIPKGSEYRKDTSKNACVKDACVTELEHLKQIEELL